MPELGDAIVVEDDREQRGDPDEVDERELEVEAAPLVLGAGAISAAVPIPTSATITIRYAHQARVVRTLSSSERTSAVASLVSPPVSSRKTSSSVARSTVSSCRTIP